MTDKVLVIISSSDAEKVRTGMMYAVNSMRQAWLSDVKLIIFGPAQALLLKDRDLQERVALFQKIAGKAVACSYIADRDGIAVGTRALGIEVEPVGALISDYIKQGYVPMVW